MPKNPEAKMTATIMIAAIVAITIGAEKGAATVIGIGSVATEAEIVAKIEAGRMATVMTP